MKNNILFSKGMEVGCSIVMVRCISVNDDTYTSFPKYLNNEIWLSVIFNRHSNMNNVNNTIFV